MATNPAGANCSSDPAADGAQDAVARLADGVAHEINTPIQFVGDSLRFLNDAFVDVTQVVDRWRELLDAARTGPLPPELLADAEAAFVAADVETLRREIPLATKRALEGLERVADVVRRVRSIVPPERPRTRTDLGAVLEEVATLARVEFLISTDVELALAGALPPVDGNGADLHQLFFTLVARAARAIAADPRRRDGTRGRVRIAADVAGAHVRVAVEDDGVAIPPERCLALFERRGDGDDLSSVDETVRGVLRGRILFESGVGRGTRFHLLIPIPGRVREA